MPFRFYQTCIFQTMVWKIKSPLALVIALGLAAG
jgi:hypothetical protein